MRRLNRNEWIGVVSGIVLVGFLLFGNTIVGFYKPVANNTNSMTGESQVEVQDLIVGQGDVAVAGDVLTVHYVGMLEDGKVFDSSIDRNTPFTFTLGVGEVIPGWDQGMVGMREGGKRRLVIPPQYAYGERGVGTVPPNSTLIFDVELFNVEHPNQ